VHRADASSPVGVTWRARYSEAAVLDMVRISRHTTAMPRWNASGTRCSVLLCCAGNILDSCTR
jgi:hypothetical protein